MIRSAALCLAVAALVYTAGCASSPKERQEPFLEKWQTRAKESRGHSPRSKGPLQRELDVFQVPDETEESSRDLPQKQLSGLKFREESIAVILRTLADAAGQNLVMSSSVQGRMSMDLEDVPWDEAFLSVLRTNGLTYVRDGDIIRVQSIEDHQRTQRLQKAKRMAKELQTTVVDLGYAHIVDREDGRDREEDDKLDRLEQTLQELLQNMGEEDRDEESRQGRVFVDRENNALIIQATKADTRRLLHVVKHLERPREQIHIQASIVEATRNTARELGMRWRGRYVTSSGGVDDLGVIGEASEPEDWGSVIDTLPGDESDAIGGLKLGTVAGEIAGNVLFSQLQALEKDGRLNILASPSLTTMENLTASTRHGERIPYETVDEDGERIVEFEDVALGLEVKPRVIDGELMAMDITVTKDEADFTRDVRGNPVIRTKETTTSLLVRSGETIVISGLSKQTVRDTDQGVPGLRSIPGLGWLFKGQSTAEDMEEFMVFITPTILEEPGV